MIGVESELEVRSSDVSRTSHAAKREHWRKKHAGRNNAHGLGITPVLALSGIFLHLLVRDLEMRKGVAHDQSNAILRAEIALVIHAEITGSSIVRVIFRNHRIQVMPRHVAIGTEAQRISLPLVLRLGETACRVEAAA